MERYVEAQTYLTRALQADPTDYRIYLALARIRRIAGPYPNDNDLQTWRLAVAYAPQVMSACAQAADALLRVDRREEAAVMLTPVANNLHGGPHVERARRPAGPDQTWGDRSRLRTDGAAFGLHAPPARSRSGP